MTWRAWFILSGGVLVLALGVYFRSSPARLEEKVPGTNPSFQGSRRLPGRVGQRSAGTESAGADAMISDLLASAGVARQNIPPEAYLVIRQAVRSVCFAEKERRRLAEGKNTWGVTAVSGMSRKLFLDDFAFAGNLSPQVDCSQAGTVFSNLDQSIRLLTDSDIETVFKAKEPAEP